MNVPVEGFTTAKATGFEVPPPGAGLVTVTAAVPAVAMAVTGTAAVSFELLTKVVVSAAPFHLTTAVDAKPVPLTVRANAAPPGAAAAGTRGWFTRGTEFTDIN
jgi:hypothetical protein